MNPIIIPGSSTVAFPGLRGDKKPNPAVPNYEGRLLCLNPEHPKRTFQCYGFILGGPKNQSGIVPGHASMAAIHQAVIEQRLLDITDEGEIKTPNSTLSTLEETATSKKVYFVRRAGGGVIAFGTEDKQVQEKLDADIAKKGAIELPPGFGEEEKYLLKPQQEPVMTAADIARARELYARQQNSKLRRLSAVVSSLLKKWVGRTS